MQGQDALFSHKLKLLESRVSKFDMARFAKHFLLDDPDKCWIWIGAKNEKGYGLFKLGEKKGNACKAHRVSYAFFHGGEISECTLHTCDNRACVNPNHLISSTQLENMKDMYAKGRGFLKKGYKRSEVFKK